MNECYGCGEKTRVMLDGMCRICAAKYAKKEMERINILNKSKK